MSSIRRDRRERQPRRVVDWTKFQSSAATTSRSPEPTACALVNPILLDYVTRDRNTAETLRVVTAGLDRVQRAAGHH